MGSQGSKVGHWKEEMMPKLPPVLCRKLEEIKRRRAAGTALSKKQLLKDGVEDDSTDGPKSTVSSPEPDDDSLRSADAAPEPIDPSIFSDKEVMPEEKSKERDNKVNDGGEDHKTEAMTTAMEKLVMEEPEDNKKVVEEHGRLNNVERPLSLICPASPSFRFYLTENEKDNDSSKDDYMIKGSLSDTDVDAADEIVESQTSTEELGSKIKKRGRRGMIRFRMGKNLLKVKSCYYPSCGGRHEISRRLITQKSATL